MLSLGLSLPELAIRGQPVAYAPLFPAGIAANWWEALNQWPLYFDAAALSPNSPDTLIHFAAAHFAGGQI
jgi:hypothetical protein